MHFLSLWMPAQPMAGMPTPEHMAAMGNLVQEMMGNGSLVATGPLGNARESVTVRQSQGQYDVHDAPDAVGGMRAGGYAILNANDMQGAIALARRFMAVAGDGECHLRAIPMMPPAGQQPAASSAGASIGAMAQPAQPPQGKTQQMQKDAPQSNSLKKDAPAQASKDDWSKKS